MKNKLISFVLILSLFALTSGAMYVTQPEVTLQKLADAFGNKSYANGVYANMFVDLPVANAYFRGKADAYLEAQQTVNNLITPPITVPNVPLAVDPYYSDRY